jgi:hypothetical protein
MATGWVLASVAGASRPSPSQHLLVQLLALVVKVIGCGYHAQDHEDVPYEAQEVEGLLMIEEVLDRRELTDISYVQPEHGRGLVVRSILQRPVKLPDMPGLVRRGEHALVHESQQDFALLIVPVLVRGIA